MVVVIIIVVLVVAWICYEVASKKKEEKEDKEKGESLKDRAGKGDPNVDFDLGVWYLGHGNLPEARQWFEKALQQGYSEAESKLKVCSLMEKGLSLDTAEGNCRFKEAVEKGMDPKIVVGFKKIEDIPELKDSKIHFMVKEICMALVARGYNLDYPYPLATNDKNRGYGANISVISFINAANERKYLGHIEFWDSVKSSLVSDQNYHYTMDHLQNRHMESKLCHMIQKLPYIIIKSEAALPESPPEWLIICADVIKTYSISSSISDPEWVSEHPEAKRYINAMF